MASKTIKIAALLGSLRKDSINKKVLDAAVKLLPANASIEVVDWSKIPNFNQDDEKDNYHPAAKAAKDVIRGSDAVLIVTPEYNYSFPGGLKNAIDYISRPYGTSPFGGKAVSVIGANNGKNLGTSGTSRAQLAWRSVFVFLNLTAVNQPEVIVADGDSKFDDNGNLKDEFLKKLLTDHLKALVDLATKLKTPTSNL